ncbi:MULTISPECIES: hypothetical protein [unclassified Crossiella]|uniref:hypothetical protein n=1 Tax=unclassified Crossiella TaxID=2620835 RepID=UPI001FFF4DE1|nr:MULTISPECIES: hypothetical protein [unclassified Crossiella]MCK2240095.1 hypothetical protein [Crossiella sp. S99.2]MCK2252804.1 hypothetical protein [Crossiella sp. S99.1]
MRSNRSSREPNSWMRTCPGYTHAVEEFAEAITPLIRARLAADTGHAPQEITEQDLVAVLTEQPHPEALLDWCTVHRDADSELSAPRRAELRRLARAGLPASGMPVSPWEECAIVLTWWMGTGAPAVEADHRFQHYDYASDHAEMMCRVMLYIVSGNNHTTPATTPPATVAAVVRAIRNDGDPIQGLKKLDTCIGESISLRGHHTDLDSDPVSKALVWLRQPHGGFYLTDGGWVPTMVHGTPHRPMSEAVRPMLVVLDAAAADPTPMPRR